MPEPEPAPKQINYEDLHQSIQVIVNFGEEFRGKSDVPEFFSGSQDYIREAIGHYGWQSPDEMVEAVNSKMKEMNESPIELDDIKEFFPDYSYKTFLLKKL